jgi:D-galacturonate reductase
MCIVSVCLSVGIFFQPAFLARCAKITVCRMDSLPACLAVGIGEYVTGYVHGAASQSDKKVGVVGLVLFDLRRRGKVGRILLAGTSGSKFPGIRHHFEQVCSLLAFTLPYSFD